jgi:caffeoyl-CoA O-methyltransferase
MLPGAMDIVPPRIRAVMHALEERDERDRSDGTPRPERLRAIRPEVGDLLCSLALASRARTIVEIGTSGGYSTLWLAVAAGRTGGRVTTFEIDPAKVALATTTFAEAGVAGLVDLRAEDGLAGLGRLDGGADLVFLDAEKEDYEAFVEGVVRALRPGGVLVADNLLSHAEALEGFRHAALGHPSLQGLVVPVGRGELLAVKI